MHNIKRMFPTPESALIYLEECRWPDGVTCSKCGSSEKVRARKNNLYRCYFCSAHTGKRAATVEDITEFGVKTGTIFQHTRMPLNVWLYVIHVLALKGKACSWQIHIVLGLKQRTVWYMLERLKKVFGEEFEDMPRVRIKKRQQFDGIIGQIMTHQQDSDSHEQ